MWFLPRTISTRHKGVHLLVKENFSDIIGSASWAGPKCTVCSTCENSWSSIHVIYTLSWCKIYCNKQFTKESILLLDSQWEERLHWEAVRSGKQLLFSHFSYLKHAVMSPSSWFQCDFSLLSSPNLNTYTSYDIGSLGYIRLPQVVTVKDSNSFNIWL